MTFNTNKNIEQAKKLIDSGEEENLYYACLELRYALEKIAYQKLRLRLDKVTVDEIASWQPRRALERLIELVDEHLEHDTVIRMATEDEYGVAPVDKKFVTIGKNKGITPKHIGKYWQKLGSYLHVKMPKTKNGTIEKQSSDNLIQSLNEIIDYIENITSTKFDAHFSQNVTFQCSKCEQSIVRNEKLLRDQHMVECQNSQCPAAYIAHKDGDNFTFTAFLSPLGCKKCGAKTHLEMGPILKMPYRETRLWQCGECLTSHEIRWSIEYGLIEEEQSQASEGR